MKKNILHILIGILIIAQMVTILKINNLKREIEDINEEMDNLSNRIRREVNTIYSNIDAMLKKEESLIEIASAKIGVLNKEEFTAPVTFTLTPKEVSEYTAVSLDFDGELVPMEKKGTTFVATVFRNIFGNALPKIVIDEKGVKKITQDDRVIIRSIKEEVYPVIVPRLTGRASYSDDSKIYTKKGNLTIDIKKAPSEIEFEEIRFVIKVDNKVISDEIISKELTSLEYEVDVEIPLNIGQICTMVVVAIDSMGLEHHYTVDCWIAGAKYPNEPWLNEEKIYSADGNLIWQTNSGISINEIFSSSN